jgi:acyl-CoA thioesterase
MPDAIFTREGETFVPTDLARSPWSPMLLHGGPPAGLLARAVERANPDPAMHVARLTIDLFRPVPKAPLTVTTRFVREGKRILVTEASLLADGSEVSRASALLLRQSDVDMPEAHLPPSALHPGPEGLPTTGLGAVMNRDGEAVQPARTSGAGGFHTTIEVRRVSGEPGTGRGTAWIRIPVPFVLGEAITPLVRAAATSDFGNALGHIRPSEEVGFINADITLYLHRLPEGEWLCLETASSGQPHGLGLVESVMYDAQGPIGRVAQALIVNRRALA